MEAHRQGASGQNGNAVVPVFPLPNVFLFPGCVMPLHIFEPRYRQMVDDLLDRPGRLVMGTLLDECDDCNGQPAILEVGGLGEIGRHQRLPDGRYLIWLIGLSRVRLREVRSDRLYRKVEIEMLAEIEVARDDEAEVRSRVQHALLARCQEFLILPCDLPLTHLVDLLLQKVHPPPSVMQELYCETNLRNRAERALLEHARRPMTPSDESN